MRDQASDPRMSVAIQRQWRAATRAAELGTVPWFAEGFVSTLNHMQALAVVPKDDWPEFLHAPDCTIPGPDALSYQDQVGAYLAAAYGPDLGLIYHNRLEQIMGFCTTHHYDVTPESLQAHAPLGPGSATLELLDVLCTVSYARPSGWGREWVLALPDHDTLVAQAAQLEDVDPDEVRCATPLPRAAAARLESGFPWNTYVFLAASALVRAVAPFYDMIGPFSGSTSLDHAATFLVRMYGREDGLAHTARFLAIRHCLHRNQAVLSRQGYICGEDGLFVIAPSPEEYVVRYHALLHGLCTAPVRVGRAGALASARLRLEEVLRLAQLYSPPI
jgi:hypothetical protein